MIAAFAVLLAARAATPDTLELQLPVSGWTAAPSTQVVVAHARPDVPISLSWFGVSWLLWPNEIGRAGVYLPLLSNRTTFEVDQPGRGSATAQVLETGKLPDLAVIVAWEPGARFDLQITDPSGEVCDSANRQTSGGGVRLRDDPEAPGPHVFEAVRGQAGAYRIALACGRLPAGRSVRVRALAVLLPGTAAEERRDLSTVVTRCDEVTELGAVQLVGRPQR